MAETERSWEKRLAGGPDELAVDFVESLSIDKPATICPTTNSYRGSPILREPIRFLPTWLAHDGNPVGFLKEKQQCRVNRIKNRQRVLN